MLYSFATSSESTGGTTINSGFVRGGQRYVYGSEIENAPLSPARRYGTSCKANRH